MTPSATAQPSKVTTISTRSGSLSSAHDSSVLHAPNPSTSLPSIAGTGRPGSPREFPILGSNFSAKHWDALGVDLWSEEQGIFSATPSLYAMQQSVLEQAEENLVQLEEEEALAEVDQDWEDYLDENAVAEGPRLTLTAEQKEKLFEGRRRREDRRRLAREAGWVEVVSTFCDMARRHISSINEPIGIRCRTITTRVSGFFNNEGKELIRFNPYVAPTEITKRLASFALDETEALFPGGALSMTALTELWSAGGSATRSSGLENLRSILRGVGPSVGLLIKDDKAERVELILEAGISSFLKPSVLSYVLAIPRYRISDWDGVEKVYQHATFYGVRKLLNFATEAKENGVFTPGLQSCLFAVLMRPSHRLVRLRQPRSRKSRESTPEVVRHRRSLENEGARLDGPALGRICASQ